MRVKPRIGLTLFEDQLIRIYLTSRDGAFLKSLVLEFQVYIFCSDQYLDVIENHLYLYGLQEVQVVVFRGRLEKVTSRFFSSPLRWGQKSRSIRLKIARKPTLNRIICWISYGTIPRIRSSKRLLRTFLYRTLGQKSLQERFNNGSAPDLDFLFVSSLTNHLEDFVVALFYRRLGVKILGTVRSWDNLSSHGNLYLLPDYFFSHSPWMTKAAILFQDIEPSQIVSWGNPAYTSEFKSAWLSEVQTPSLQPIAVSYASMLATNRDDLHMIEWLVASCKQMEGKIVLTILEHPKFLLPIDFKERILRKYPGCVTFVNFPYLSSKLEDYYRFLHSQDLVICGGTSVVLDCAFTATPVALLATEIRTQPYRYSGLRYFDTFEHSVELIGVYDYLVLDSKENVLDFFRNIQEEIPTSIDANEFVGFSVNSRVVNLVALMHQLTK